MTFHYILYSSISALANWTVSVFAIEISIYIYQPFHMDRKKRVEWNPMLQVKVVRITRQHRKCSWKLIQYFWIDKTHMLKSDKSINIISFCSVIDNQPIMEKGLHERDIVGLQDFVLLEDCNSEDAFIENLKKRFHADLIYVGYHNLNGHDENSSALILYYTIIRISADIYWSGVDIR